MKKFMIVVLVMLVACEWTHAEVPVAWTDDVPAARTASVCSPDCTRCDCATTGTCVCASVANVASNEPSNPWRWEPAKDGKSGYWWMLDTDKIKAIDPRPWNHYSPMPVPVRANPWDIADHYAPKYSLTPIRQPAFVPQLAHPALAPSMTGGSCSGGR